MPSGQKLGLPLVGCLLQHCKMEGPWDHAKEQKAIMEKYAYSKEVQVVLGRMVKVGAPDLKVFKFKPETLRKP